MIRRAKERGARPDRAGRPARAVHRDRAGDRFGRGDDRASRTREAREKHAGTQREHAQRHHRQDGHDRRRGARHHRGAARPGRLVRAGHRQKRQRRLNDVDEVAPSLYAKGLTTGEISAHFAQIGAPTKLAKRELGDLSRTRPCALTVQLRSRMKSKITSKTCWLQKSYSCSAPSTSTSCASTPCSTSRSRILTD